MNENINQYIRSVSLSGMTNFDEYPYNLSIVKSLDQLMFHENVTFLVGENGSGKSTLLEAIAIAYGFNPEGGSKNMSFATEDSHSSLSNDLIIVKGITKPLDGYFLRAESFYNVASNIDQVDRDSKQYGLGRPIIESYGGESLHHQSHGEAFMTLMMNRFSGKGLYILDEPEAALSPSRQLAMMSRIFDLVKQGSQFIIATHSPILLGYPDAIIYSADDDLKAIDYEETEHFQLMKIFINNRGSILKHLFE